MVNMMTWFHITTTKKNQVLKKKENKKSKKSKKINKRDLFWNFGGLGDPKKFKFSSACLQRKAKTSLTYQKHEVDISLHSFSKHPVV